MILKIESATSPKSNDLIRNFLNEHSSGVLATADAARNPHAAVIYFTLQDDFSLLFSTKRETQKFKNIEENKQVAFVVYDEKEQSTVQIFGHSEIITDHDKQQEAIDNMFHASAERSNAAVPPAEKFFAGEYVVLRVIPQVIKLAIFARPDSEGENIFETLLFSQLSEQI